MIEAVQVVTTTSSEDEARRIAAELIAERLAACVQIAGPIESHYRWQGKLESAREWLLTIKTARSLYPQVESAIRKTHSYDEPEILATPIVAGSAGYLTWLQDSLRSPE